MITLKGSFKHPLFRYLFVGGITYIVDIGVLIGLHSGLHAQRAVAAGVSFWVGLCCSFVLQKLVAFQDYEKELKAISKQAVWYAVLVGFNYGLTLLIVSLFPDKDLILSRTAAVAVTSCWNYIFYKKIIFRMPKHTVSISTHTTKEITDDASETHPSTQKIPHDPSR